MPGNGLPQALTWLAWRLALTLSFPLCTNQSSFNSFRLIGVASTPLEIPHSVQVLNTPLTPCPVPGNDGHAADDSLTQISLLGIRAGAGAVQRLPCNPDETEQETAGSSADLGVVPHGYCVVVCTARVLLPAAATG